MPFVRRSLVVVATAALVGGCGDGPVRPPPASRLELVKSPPSLLVVGSHVLPPPAIVVREPSGKVISGLRVAVTVREGEGTIVSPARVTRPGLTPVGDWLLSTRTGRNKLVVTVEGLPPLEIVVNGTSEAPSTIAPFAGEAQTAYAGAELEDPLAVRLVDKYGNGVAGKPVSFSVTGGGELSVATVATDSEGVAGGVRWRIGRHGGPQRVSAQAGTLSVELSAGVRTAYTPLLRFFGNPPSAAIQKAFTAAVARIESVVVGDVPDVPLQNFDIARCGVTGAPLSETVDDVLIYATVTTIDGPGNILGAAGPCIARSSGGPAVIGVMRFDVDDFNQIVSSGRLEAVITHEMLHIVGIGTLWRQRNLVFGSGTDDPRYQGAQGATECITAGGGVLCGDGRVPLENVGGSGTLESHWRETTFDSELMTGYVEANPDMPLSAVTVASLADVGFAVNVLAADPFFLPPTAANVLPRGSSQLSALWDIVELPRYEVTKEGWVRPVSWK